MERWGPARPPQIAATFDVPYRDLTAMRLDDTADSSPRPAPPSSPLREACLASQGRIPEKLASESRHSYR